jgi:tetratricopeptide (TPR) repeat protein
LRSFLLSVSLLLSWLSITAVAQPAAEAERYERCMALARKDPTAAWEMALAWQAEGGYHPADHCAAVALIGLHQYGEAGMRLEALAQAMVRAPKELRAEVLDQAGQAWLLLGNAERAQADLSAALKLAPDAPDLLIDRAEAAGARGRFKEAVADLDRALKRAPDRTDALVFRASAYRAEGKLGPALADVEKALALAPNSPDALLERGNIRRLKGDKAGARQDWLRVSLLAPDSPADVAAKANLEHLDLHSEPAPAPKKR